MLCSNKFFKKKNFSFIISNFFIYGLKFILVFMEVTNHTLSLFIVMFKHIYFNQIEYYFCVFVVDNKRVFKKINSLFSITIPIFTESIASENFMIFSFSEFKCFLKVFFGIKPVIFFHF